MIDTAEETSVIGVHFKPGGAFPFLGVPVGELADLHVDLEALWGSAALELRERLCAAATPAERFALLERALTARLCCPLEHHRAVPVALRALGRPDARPRIRDVAQDPGLSHRRLVEVFTAEVGLTPKLFCRVQRFQRALAFVRQSAEAPNWAMQALDCGYFDQSHLIHDVLTFSGLTPAAYFRQQRSLRERGVHIKRNHLPLPE